MTKKITEYALVSLVLAIFVAMLGDLLVSFAIGLAICGTGAIAISYGFNKSK